MFWFSCLDLFALSFKGKAAGKSKGRKGTVPFYKRKGKAQFSAHRTLSKPVWFWTEALLRGSLKGKGQGDAIVRLQSLTIKMHKRYMICV
jgi:hypothetical protein